ncbi:MAG: phenylalanine--tRNA ligase subunit alpha [Lachnospiraceae bacterium]|nr:phenylalanine--tRNA ligase subunit alpha [Lachnospiraceae bacterium]
MDINLDKIKDKAIESIDNASDLKALDDIRVSYFGKKGEITAIMQRFKELKDEERKELGKAINLVKSAIEDEIKLRQKKFTEKILGEKLKREAIDVTLPSKKVNIGHLHPCTIVYNDVRKIFEKMGYTVVTGPEIEYDLYNFEKLNIEKGHPARDEQDTFYINDKVLLRTQTSPVQARVMEKGKLPICIISAGRVFRSDSVDATHSPTFHQIEGLVVSDNISFADLKGTLTVFAKSFFGNDIKTRFRPHHFPFTEPSAEMDVSCFKCGGKGCRFCKNEGWIEILGCGMVNPKVYELCGLDKDKCQGFAFGIGIERLALLKYEIDDMRLLYENDMRFLNQFD